MKKIVISGILALVSSLWAIAISVYVEMNPVLTWMDSRYWETAAQRGVLVPLLLSLIVLLWSLISLIAAYFRKEK